MLWETIKNRVAAFVANQPSHEGSEYIQREANAHGVPVRQYLDTVDIRRAAALREHVPEAFPRELRIGMLYADHNNKGQWAVHGGAK